MIRHDKKINLISFLSPISIFLDHFTIISYNSLGAETMRSWLEDVAVEGMKTVQGMPLKEPYAVNSFSCKIEGVTKNAC